MKVDFFNVVWQTLNKRQLEERSRRKAWALIKWVIRIAVLVWKILKFFFDESGPS